MTTLVFDPHRAVKALPAAEPLAEVVVAPVGGAVGANAVTKLVTLEPRLHRQLWVMAAGIGDLIVAPIKLTA